MRLPAATSLSDRMPRKPVRMKPACAIEEYASSRLMSVWVSASTEPTTIVRIATTQIIGVQSFRSPPKAT